MSCLRGLKSTLLLRARGPLFNEAHFTVPTVRTVGGGDFPTPEGPGPVAGLQESVFLCRKEHLAIVVRAVAPYRWQSVGFRHRPGAYLRTAVAEFCGCPGRESSVAPPAQYLFQGGGIDPKKIGKRLQIRASDTMGGRLIAGLKLSCFDHFSSALESAATFLGIICGEKAVTDGPSTQRKTRCCEN